VRGSLGRPGRRPTFLTLEGVRGLSEALREISLLARGGRSAPADLNWFDLQLPDRSAFPPTWLSLHWPLPAPTRHPPPTVPPKSASFARSIPPWFVLSYNLPMTNTRAIWLRSGALLTPLLSPHLPLFNLTGHWPLFPRHLPPEPPSAGTSGVRSCADLPPLAIAGEPTAEFPMNSRVLFCIFVHFRLPPPVHGASGSRAPAQRLPKTELGPISTSAPLSHYSPNQAIPAGKSIHSPPLAATQPLTILSWPETLNATSSRRACRMAITRNTSPFMFVSYGSHAKTWVGSEIGMVSPEYSFVHYLRPGRRPISRPERRRARSTARW